MSIEFGFYNGPNRKYNAEQMSRIFDGLINDGVYATLGDHLIITANPDEVDSIIVGTGRAWFNHTWTWVKSSEVINGPEREITKDRKDAIVLDIDSETKTNQILWVKGNMQGIAPTMINTETHHQYPLAYVWMNSGDSRYITQDNIINCIGTSECPFVTGIIDTVDTDELVLKWETQFENLMLDNTTTFNSLFEELRGILDEDAAGKLLNKIEDLRTMISLLPNRIVGDFGNYLRFNVDLDSEYNNGPCYLVLVNPWVSMRGLELSSAYYGPYMLAYIDIKEQINISNTTNNPTWTDVGTTVSLPVNSIFNYTRFGIESVMRSVVPMIVIPIVNVPYYSITIHAPRDIYKYNDRRTVLVYHFQDTTGGSEKSQFTITENLSTWIINDAINSPSPGALMYLCPWVRDTYKAYVSGVEGEMIIDANNKNFFRRMYLAKYSLDVSDDVQLPEISDQILGLLTRVDNIETKLGLERAAFMNYLPVEKIPNVSPIDYQINMCPGIAKQNAFLLDIYTYKVKLPEEFEASEGSKIKITEIGFRRSSDGYVCTIDELDIDAEVEIVKNKPCLKCDKIINIRSNPFNWVPDDDLLICDGVYLTILNPETDSSAEIFVSPTSLHGGATSHVKLIAPSLTN